MTDCETPALVAIDGTAASGKSTLGRRIADRFGYRLLDTGAMYRAFTVAAIEAGIPPGDEEGCSQLATEVLISAGGESGDRAWIGDREVTLDLRTAPVEAAVSDYSRIAGVRAVLVERQRAFAAEGGVVVVGRDIGTVVLPHAPAKLFLQGSETARAERRGRQSRDWGAREPDSTADIRRRDTIDSGRAVSPLAPAPDATIIDTTDLSVDEVFEEALRAMSCG